MTDDRSFAVGLVLEGRYRLERPLGQGGMGTVWVGHQLTLGREVAIKSIRPGRTQDQARLSREARLLAAVRHPAIVQIYDFGRTPEGLAYVVMELVRGPSLDARLSVVGRVPCEEAVSLLLPLLDGLHAVHAAGIVHRDIKPANILLASEGVEGAPRVMPKLLDFGIARDEDASSLTMEGDLVGTPAYMAPEQFMGLRADARADLWAVAATLYDMIAGEPPFVGNTLFDIMRRAKEDPPPFPRQAIGLDGALWRVLTDTLRKRPDERPESALLLRQRLSDWLSLRGGPREASVLATKAPDPAPTVAREAPTQAPPPSSPALSGAPRGPESVSSPPSSPSFDALIQQRLKET